MNQGLAIKGGLGQEESNTGLSSKQAGTSTAGEFRERRHEVPTVVAATIALVFGLFYCVFLSQRKMRPRLSN